MDTLLTILRDPIWQFVGVVIAIIALFATKFIKNWLRYVVLSVIIVLICTASFFVFVQKQWDKSNPHNLYVQVTNSNTSLYDPLNEQNTNN